MSTPFKANAISKFLLTLLTLDGIVSIIHEAASNFKDKRQGSNKLYRMEDFVLSAAFKMRIVD